MTQAAAANPAPEELVLEYQPTDEAGQPIGKKTVIKGASWEEIARKQVTVNEMAVRAYHRLKNAQPTRRPEAVETVLSPEEEIRLTAELNDPSKSRKSLRTLVDAEFGISKRLEKIDLYAEQQRRNSAAIRFLRSHANDYYVCDANNSALDGYLEQNGLDYTPENYEIAFAALSDSLAQSPTPAAPPVEANPAPPARRPQATPDIRPGELNGAPAPKAKGLTKADYLKMAVKDPKEYQRHMTNTVLRRALDKALAS
jgi:hypothetical protein